MKIKPTIPIEEETEIEQKTITTDKETRLNKKSLFPWKNNKAYTKDNTKEPLLLLIKDNHDIEAKEGIMPGLTEITKTDGKKAYIILSKSKLCKMPNGLQVWIASESEATAYPTNTKHDSETLFALIRKVIANYKSIEPQKWANWAQFVLYTGIAIAVVIGAIGLFKVDLTPYIPWATKTVTSTVQVLPTTIPPVTP